MSKPYEIDERVVERVMEPYPNIEELVAFSTPVVSFGYPNDASIATLGINPSCNEFQIGRGNKNPLPFGAKKLVDTQSLNLIQPKSLNREQAIQVIVGCYSYFEGKPYDWFNDLQEYALNPLGASYRDGTACHLDLVQWATDPVWQNEKMSKKSKDLLLASDKKFLEYQLTQNNFKYILLNGGTVVKQVKNLGILKLETIDKIRFNKNGVMSEIVRGSLGTKTYIGWGLNAGYGATFKGGLEDLSNWLSKNLEKIN